MDLTVPLCFYPLNIKYCHGVALLSALLKQRGIGVELLMLGEREPDAGPAGDISHRPTTDF